MKSLEDEVKNIEDEKEFESEQKRREEKISISFERVLATEDGRVVLKAILEMCPLEVDDFSLNSNQMSYNCGRKSIGVELRNFLKMKFKNSVMQSIENTEI